MLIANIINYTKETILVSIKCLTFEIQYNPAHSIAIAHLQQGESVRAEAKAMIYMSPGCGVDTNTGPAGQGFFKKLGRGILGGESFFQNVFRAEAPNAQVGLAPTLCGSMQVHELNGREELLIQASSYVAAPDSVTIDTQFQGFKGFFSGESLFFLKASGSGPLL